MNRFKQLPGRRRRYDDLAVSMREHLEEKIAGSSREVWHWTALESLLMDVRFALRQLRKSPGFLLTVCLTLALGIGATTAIFTLMQQVMMRSLPVARPHQLWRIGDGVHCCYSNGYTQRNRERRRTTGVCSRGRRTSGFGRILRRSRIWRRSDR